MQQRLHLGRAIGGTIKFWFRNLIPCLALSVAVFAPWFLYTFVLAQYPHLLPAALVDGEVYRAGDQLVSQLLTALLEAAMATWIAARLRADELDHDALAQAWLVGRRDGRPSGARQSVAAAARQWPTVLGAALVLTAILGLPPVLLEHAHEGLVLLGAVVLMVLVAGLFVTMPIAVLESRGVFGSLARSWSLTRGSRLRIFGTFLALAIAYGAVAAVVGIDDLLGWQARIALGAVIASIFSVLSTIVYWQLRAMAEPTPTAPPPA